MLMIKERRLSPRITVNLTAGETVGGKYFLPLVSDISPRSVRLESPAGLERPPSHQVMLELMLPGCPDIVRARCRVLREENHGFFKSRVLSFVNISPYHRQLINGYLKRCLGRQ